MRLIDADALMKTLKISDDCKHCEQCEYDYFCSMGGDFVSACEAINDAPSIDIVRCKECKWLRYCETEDLDPYLDCDKPDGGGIPRSEEWFCADGEREGE